MTISPMAGKPANPSILSNIPKLEMAYYSEIPDPSNRDQKVAFGTSGHRGSSLKKSFNEWHILAITQAICQYRKEQNITGPLFMGMDTHALSVPAMSSALEVLAANGVTVILAENDEFTPTPVISHAILTYNKGRKKDLADGIVITPSHNPPGEGGFKYNPPNGGPAEQHVTGWIEKQANEFLAKKLSGVNRMDYEKALVASTTKRHNYLKTYVEDLINVIDMDVISKSQIKLGVDPLGGAGVHYWKAIVDRYKLNLTVVSDVVDPTFSFMTVDWDGQIRMDPSSQYAMRRLIGLKDRFKVAFACDTDHDRHGIVANSCGLMQSNQYLATSIYYLFQHRPKWSKSSMVGKTVVSSQMIDKVSSKLDRKVYEVPVGFKWYVDGLMDGSLAFVGEESAGATFLRLDGTVWTTDKDGFIPALLAAEMTARLGKDPGEIYEELTQEFGISYFDRVDAPATPEQKELLKKLSAKDITSNVLAGDPIKEVITKASGNQEAIGGLKVISEHGWFAARPSGTENIYKIYAESFRSEAHLKEIVKSAQQIVNHAFSEIASKR